MTAFVVVAAAPWVLGLVLWWAARGVVGRLTPGAAVVVVPLLAVVTVVATVLSAVAVSALLISYSEPAASVVGVVALLAVGWRLIVGVVHLLRVRSSMRSAALFAGPHDGHSSVVIVDDPEPAAFASPARGGAVVVTSGLIDALDDEQFAAVVDHEKAHLRYRHHLWIQVAQTCAEVNPMVRPFTALVRHAAERQADEFAARGDRRIVSIAIARVALMTLPAKPVGAADVPAGSGGDIVERVRALTRPVPPRQDRAVLVALALVVVALVALSVGLFDVVQDVVVPETGEAPTSVFR